jgi:hypothetical protein
MKAMLTGFVAMIVIAGVAWYGLNEAGFSAKEVGSSDSVRLD